MGTNKKIVSIVDDEKDITDLFHDALSNKITGISVFSFNDPLIALEHFIDNKKNYALVISDLRMPGMNGLELLKKIRKFNPKVRTILISAYEVDNDPVFRGYVKERVIDSFIQKPIAIGDLCKEVNYLVYSSQTMRNK
ncbi:MAG: response regulator [Nitrososphaerota archaeon]